jgi:hypothetical protein
MPTVLRVGPYVFVFFSSDRAEPVHIHVKRDRRVAKFWLESIELGWSWNIGNSSLRNGMSTLTLEHEPLAASVTVSRENLTVGLADGRSLSVLLAWYPRLAQGTEAERAHWQLLGDGYAVEWPDLDEHSYCAAASKIRSNARRISRLAVS